MAMGKLYYISESFIKKIEEETGVELLEKMADYEVMGVYEISLLKEYLIENKEIKEDKIEELVEDMKSLYIFKYESTVGNDSELEDFIFWYRDRIGELEWQKYTIKK